MKALLFGGLALLLTISFACKKDPQDSDCTKLEGIWNIESWTGDGVQFLGDTALIASSTVNFKVQTDGQGDYEWNTDYLIGGSDFVIGSYTVNSDCNEVSLTPKGGTAHVDYGFHFEGDQLILNGNIGGVESELKLRK